MCNISLCKSFVVVVVVINMKLKEKFIIVKQTTFKCRFVHFIIVFQIKPYFRAFFGLYLLRLFSFDWPFSIFFFFIF